MAKEKTAEDRRFDRFKELNADIGTSTVSEMCGVSQEDLTEVLKSGKGIPISVGSSGSKYPELNARVGRAIYTSPAFNPTWWNLGTGDRFGQWDNKNVSTLLLTLERLVKTGLSRDSIVTLLHRDCGGSVNRGDVASVLDALERFEQKHFKGKR